MCPSPVNTKPSLVVVLSFVTSLLRCNSCYTEEAMSQKRGRPPKKVSCSPETDTSGEGTTETAVEGNAVAVEAQKEGMVGDEEESAVDTIKSTPNHNPEVLK